MSLPLVLAHTIEDLLDLVKNCKQEEVVFFCAKGNEFETDQNIQTPNF